MVRQEPAKLLSPVQIWVPPFLTKTNSEKSNMASVSKLMLGLGLSSILATRSVAKMEVRPSALLIDRPVPTLSSGPISEVLHQQALALQRFVIKSTPDTLPSESIGRTIRKNWSNKDVFVSKVRPNGNYSGKKKPFWLVERRQKWAFNRID